MSKDNNLLFFGLGVGAGLCGIWLAIELLPFAALGGVGYLILKGLEQRKESSQDGNTLD